MALSEIEKLRLMAGDTDPDFPWLSDEQYQNFIDEFPNKRKRSKAIDLALLAVKANDIHERSGQEERWGNQAFENSLNLVKLKWKDPSFNGVQATPSFGGTSREEMFDLATDPDRVPDTFYKGESFGKAEWQTRRIYRFYCRNEEPYIYRIVPYVI
ncbi:hypothetical protein [Acinetobacter baumannii]|uniref:hypothetical protein n=1 Tax=Acinetobacter baumannii TaxID=470 RepID=UPI00366E0DFC